MKKILFLEKVFLGARSGPVRGVEIFNMNLVRDLSELGYGVTVPMHADWLSEAGRAWGNNVEAVSYRLSRRPPVNGIAAVLSLRKERYDVLLLANTANGLIPALSLSARLGMAARYVLIAHREPSTRFVRCMSRRDARVVAVNGKIAGVFKGEAGKPADVFYGVTNAGIFCPGQRHGGGDGVTRFCVLGQLDNAWKGADTAVEGFMGLPAELRKNCELHLVSFTTPEVFPDRNIIAHRWMPFEDIPGFLRGMDVMIVPSRDENVMRETFSQAMVQGMLTGLPLVVNDLPVLVEKLDKGGGFVFRTVNELSGYMVSLTENPLLRKVEGEKARHTALSRYVWSTCKFAEKYLAV